MKIDVPALRLSFRQKVRCEYCHKGFPQGLDCSHLWSRGAGWIDVRINLAALCRACHRSSHAGEAPTKTELLKIVAAREGVTAENIIDAVFFLRRLTKGMATDTIKRKMVHELQDDATVAIVSRGLLEAGYLL